MTVSGSPGAHPCGRASAVRGGSSAFVRESSLSRTIPSLCCGWRHICARLAL